MILTEEQWESLRCESCGKTLNEIRGSKCAGDYCLGEIRLDPDQGASRSDPPIEPSYYFWCDECKNDSSEHISDATKMVGFDLERARGLRDFLQDDCAEVGDVWAEMIAEIERLREALDESERVVAHKTKSAAHWYDEYLQARADLVQTRRVVEQQAARIKALEDALVEERVIGEGGFRAEQCEFWYIEDLPEESCMELDGPCDWAKCPRKHELCDVAYQQLAEEGKIGPDADAKPHCWQITEERKAAIKELSELLTAIGCPSCHYYIQKNYGENITVLRAMLTEADRNEQGANSGL